MYTGSESTTTILMLLIALGILAWGYNRARPFGKIGIIGWLQSVVLTVPWLIGFALFTFGIYLNLVGILFLVVVCTGAYVFLGQKLREAAARQDDLDSQKSKTADDLKTHSSEVTEQSDLEEARGQSLDIGGEQPTANTQQPTTNTQSGKPESVPIPHEDLQNIQDVFGIDTFFATETIPYQEGAIFKGNLRGDADSVHSRLSAKLEEKLGDRYRLFLIESPEGKPVVVILPSKIQPEPITQMQKILIVVFAVATMATSLEAGGLLLGFEFFRQPGRYQEALPIAAGLWAVLGTHEIAHQVAAVRNNVRFSLPFLIPAWQIGCFGGINRFLSLVPNRSVLFDVAFAGPAVGGVVSLLMLLVGLLLSHPGSLFQVPSQFFQASILVGTLARVMLGSQLHQQIVDVHPLTIVGWLGLAITAINLMPAGQLDGGRIIQAIYGRKVAGRSTIATFIVLAIASFVTPLALYWAIVILVLQRDLERPSLNELTEPNDARAALGLLILFLAIATLLPLAPALASRLGIGG